jgi:8-oxo-dGTP diphosphatase
VEYGETLTRAVCREVKEEYGVDVEIIKQYPASDHIIPADNQHWAPTTFIVKIKEDRTPRIMEPEKCDDIGWFSLDHLPNPLSIITKIDIERYITEKKTMQSHGICPHCGRYDNRGVSVDAVVVHEGNILLIRRGAEPDRGKWAIPGGYVGWDESAEDAVTRELKEETGLVAKKIMFLGVYSSPARHPKQVIDIAYFITEFEGVPMFGDDAEDIRWFNLSALPKQMAFDHKKIISSLEK